MPSIRQVDNIGQVIGSNLTLTYTMFEANLGMSEVQAGDALVAFVYVPDTTANVTSITDNYGNIYTQVPGARATSSDTASMTDVWWAQNVAQVTDPGDTYQLTISIDHNGSGGAWGIVVFDVEGINGATTVLGSSETNSTPSLNGPALNGGSGAVYFAAYAGPLAVVFGNGDQLTPGFSVDAPWEIIIQPGVTGGGGYAYVEEAGMGVASLVSSGSKQATFSSNSGFNMAASVCGIAFIAAVNPLAITTTSLPNAVIGQPYSQTLQATGGTAPYSWLKISGSLPPGLSLASDGVISGTPTEGGNFSALFGASDSSSPAGAVMATLPLDCVAGGPSGGGWQSYQQVVQQRPQPAPPRPFYKPKR
jgi:hypothetical protein